MSEMPRDFSGDGVTIQVLYKMQHDIANSIHASGAVNVFIIGNKALSLQFYVRVALFKFIEESPVGCGKLSIELARLR